MSGVDLRATAARLREAQGPTRDRPAPEDRGQRLATIDRGDEGELRISLDRYQDRPFISIRVWRGGYPDPKRGIAIRLRELPDFAEAIGRAMEIAAAEADARRGGR